MNPDILSHLKRVIIPPHNIDRENRILKFHSCKNCI